MRTPYLCPYLAAAGELKTKPTQHSVKELQSAGSSGEFYTPRAVTDFMAKMINPQIGEHVADFACGTGGFLTSWLKELSKKVKTTEDQEAYDNSIYGIEKKTVSVYVVYHQYVAAWN